MSHHKYAGNEDVDDTNYPEEVYTQRVQAGKRTYFFDVRNTRSGEDFFVTITESKRTERGNERHKLFLYKEDFGKFITALHDVVHHVIEERLPEHEFEDVPELTGVEDQ